MRIYVGCSTNSRVPIKYRDLACDLATMLAHQGHKLVFNGIDDGMMGKCYMTFKYENAKTKAIVDITDVDILDNLEVDASQVAKTTFEKREMTYKASEAILILPGGVSTYAEFFSILDEKNAKKSNIPIILYNYESFFTPLLNFLKSGYNEGFVSESNLKLFDIVTDIKSLELYLKTLENKKKESE